MKKKETINIEELANYSTEQLKALWQKELKNKPTPKHRAKLIKELAYQLQAKQHGDLDKNSKVTIARRAKSYEKKLAGQTKVTTQTAKNRLEAGSTLMREWKGQTIKVDVIAPHEFQYQNKTFKSLSAIAKEVAGQHLSGPRFFGLRNE